MVDVKLERAPGHIDISVADTGIGINPAHFASIFERFGQVENRPARERAGLGLGLAIVKQLVQLHGGTVRIASAGEGQGATFVVRLPLMAASATAMSLPSAASGIDPGAVE
jgi:signal transduction histidine kinase